MSTPAIIRTSRRHLLAAFVGLAGLLTSGSLSAKPVSFDIPAQPALAALQLFGKQAGVEVAYPSAALKQIQAPAVKGEMEAAAALDALLAGTGFQAQRTGDTRFVVSEVGAPKPGSVEGVVREEGSGKAVAGAKVHIAGTENFALTDKRGRFTLEEVPAGAHVLEITAGGMQKTKVTDVIVRGGHRHTLSAVEIPALLAGVEQMEPYIVSAKKNDGVLELDPFMVEGQKPKPFSTANVDIPRTTNDAQPYYIFDAKVITLSGAADLESFLKARLTMNTSIENNGQIGAANTRGNVSSINLRGLGAGSTLVLVNGRRVATVTDGINDHQTDLNGIPLGSIERIEILPTSASGIYGGSALGGVINVILKKDYVGGEIRATYDNTFATDASRRSIAANYGMTLEDGKTHVSLSAAWTDANQLLFQDRRGLYDRGIRTILQNSPTSLYSVTTPFLGATPNITAQSSAATSLVLDNGISLPSRNTHVPVGISPSTPLANLYSSLLANAGRWNFDLPATAQQNTGLRRAFGVVPETRSFQANIKRRMWRDLDFFLEFSTHKNRSESVNTPFQQAFVLPAASPINPFTTAVLVRTPTDIIVPIQTESGTSALTVGAIVRIPHGWIFEFDYTRSENRFDSLHYSTDSTAINAALAIGALNPFVDTLAYPLSLEQYLQPTAFSGLSELDDFAWRGAGPFFGLPWGASSATFGLEHRDAHKPENTRDTLFPVTTTSNTRLTWFSRRQLTNSGYLELEIPLVKRDSLTLLRSLDLQIAGRVEKYRVDTGTPSYTTRLSTGAVTYNAPTFNGQPFFSKASYSSKNFTAGLKWQPTRDVIIRGSAATAFLPPTPAQLLGNPLPDASLSSVVDPRRSNALTVVQTISGGNPALIPQNSKSWNVGIIWAPKAEWLKGMRLNFEYYRIQQFDAIGSLDVQQIVSFESSYPERISRDASGVITLVDRSLINLFRRDTEGVDFSIDYRHEFSWGIFGLRAVHSSILKLEQQTSLLSPNLDYSDFPNEGGAGKAKSSAMISWDKKGWIATWSISRIGAYKQFGAIGGPNSLLFSNGGVFGDLVAAQGTDKIPSQTYHDLTIGYDFASDMPTMDNMATNIGSKILSGLSIHLGVKNIFNQLPPYDAFYGVSGHYTSTYGDTRLRSYWASIRKAF